MKRIITILFLNFVCLCVFSQKESADVRNGNKQYKGDKFTEAEVLYRKGLEKNNKSFEGNFNLGNALFRQEKYSDALEQYEKAAVLSPKDKQRAAAAYYNAGNAMLIDGKIAESIEAYKKSLRLNPKDDEARYNLAFAKAALQQQQQQDKDEKDDDKKDEKEDEQQQQQQKQQQQQQQEQQMSKEQAQQLLQALEQDEKETQEKAKMQQIKGKRDAEKNW
jgi:Cytochrome c biogenesis factor